MALGNCRMHSYRYSILSSGAVKQVGKGREGRFYIAAKLNKRFRSARAMKMTIKIALNLWHTKTGTKRDSNKQRPFYYSFPLPGLFPHHFTGILAKRTASGTWHWLLQPEEDTALEKRRDAARGDSRSHWLCTINGGQAANRMGGVQCWAGYHAPCYPLGKESRAIIAPLCENLCQVSVSPLNLT